MSKTTEHERIWLEPAPGADDEIGQMWARDNVWGDGATEYVRADLALSVGEQEPVGWQMRPPLENGDPEWPENKWRPCPDAELASDMAERGWETRALVHASALSTAIRELNDAEVELQIAAAKAKGDAAAIASLQAEVDMLGKQIERLEYSEGDAEHWQALAEKAIWERDEARAEVKALNDIRQANYEAMKLMGAKIENGSPSVNALRDAIEAQALVERAFRDGITYATNCVVTDVDEAWRTSAVRAALQSSPSPQGRIAEVFPTLGEAYAAALAAAKTFYDAASVEETNWTGWGDGEVPFSAEMRRVKAKQALSALRDADHRRGREILTKGARP